MLFTEQVARKPNLYPWTQEFIDSIWNGFWTANKFDFSADYAQFKTEMTDQERQIIVRTLSAIGQVEINVKRFWAQLGDNLPHPSMYDLGYAMANSEVIHNQAYEKLLDRMNMGDVFEQNLKEPVVKGRVDYLRKYLSRRYEDDRRQYVFSIILFTLFVENVSLFSQFYVIMWFNRFKNVLKDTDQQVKYTRNEENLHAQIGIKIINTLRAEYPDLFDDALAQRVKEEAKVAFAAERAIIQWMMGSFDEGSLNAPILEAYIQKRLDDSLKQIGFEPVFASEIDQSALIRTLWMEEEVNGNTVTDFFHKEPTEYSKNSKSFNVEDVFS